jgi:hypothetical protein
MEWLKYQSTFLPTGLPWIIHDLGFQLSLLPESLELVYTLVAVSDKRRIQARCKNDR